MRELSGIQKPDGFLKKEKKTLGMIIQWFLLGL